MPPRLELIDVTSTYEEEGRKLVALEHLSLSVSDAEFLAIVGPSGSGKSTILSLISGLLEPDRGEIRLNGVSTPANGRLGHAAYMQQRDLLLPWRTAIENAALGLEATSIPASEARRRASAHMARFGLDGFESAYPAQLSGGMRQRTAFLRTILPQLDLLLLDEPFGALDALTRAELQAWLAAIWEEERSTVIFVTHDVEEAIFLADRVAVLTPRPGRVAMELKIDLPRPRTRPMLTWPEFLAARGQLLAALGFLDPAPA